MVAMMTIMKILAIAHGGHTNFAIFALDGRGTRSFTFDGEIMAHGRCVL